MTEARTGMTCSEGSSVRSPLAGICTAIAIAIAGAGCGDARDLPGPKGGDPGAPAVAPLFVAVGPAGDIVTSPDGALWTPRASGVSAVLAAVAAGRPGFVAVGAGGTVVRSSDGVTWSRAASPITTDLGHVIFAGDRFVAVGGDWSTGAAAIASADGATWTEIPSPASHMFKRLAHVGGDLIVAAHLRSDLATPALFVSRTGAPWAAEQAGPFFYDSVNVDGAAVVATEAAVATSADGATWRSTPLPGGLRYTSIASGDGKLMVAGDRGVTSLALDGRLWAAPVTVLGGAYISGLAYGAGRFVATAQSGGIASSPDGVVWTTHASGRSAGLLDVTYGPASR